jgi:hypothetical protein
MVAMAGAGDTAIAATTAAAKPATIRRTPDVGRFEAFMVSSPDFMGTILARLGDP